MTKRLTPSDAWDQFVGEQTPEEFMRVSRLQGFVTPETATADYVRCYPSMVDGWPGWEAAGVHVEPALVARQGGRGDPVFRGQPAVEEMV